MKTFQDIDEVLRFAMNEEQKAVDFYTILAKEARTEDMKKIFEQFAREEVGHKARLKRIKEEGSFTFHQGQVTDLKIGDYLVDVEPSPDMGYRDALVVAMKKEQAAQKLYMDLSERAPEGDLKTVFLDLAREESKHKLRFEQEYDDYVLKEN
ncbi:MAG TPA: rubrerythrin [Bacteroidetes bacterium]|nr:rubrerythrin [Bacteroidota bacterium]